MVFIVGFFVSKENRGKIKTIENIRFKANDHAK